MLNSIRLAPAGCVCSNGESMTPDPTQFAAVARTLSPGQEGRRRNFHYHPNAARIAAR
jgi:hypothetical protein